MVVEGIFERDFAPVQGVFGDVTRQILVNLLTDLSYASLDRRSSR
jgi:ABC-type dipeptide/oligopeptide/nickel transport system permease component